MEAQSCLYSWKSHALCLGGSMQNCSQGLKGGCFGVRCLAEEAEVCELCCLGLTQLQRKGTHLQISQIYCAKFKHWTLLSSKQLADQRLTFHAVQQLSNS